MTSSFYPGYSQINAISQGVTTTLTFTEDHNFTVGEIVSFRVGKLFGMYEINNLRGKVLSKTDDTITVDIDSSTWNAFDYSVLNDPGTSPPLCVPSSSGFIPNVDIPQTNIQDAFDNRRS